MKWNHLSVDGEMGVEEGIPCSGCETLVYDLIFSPASIDSQYAEQIARAVSENNPDKEFDPFTLALCQNCMLDIQKIIKEAKMHGESLNEVQRKIKEKIGDNQWPDVIFADLLN
jgi:hypothetical protein